MMLQTFHTKRRKCAIHRIGASQAGFKFHDATPLRLGSEDIASCRKLSRLWVLAQCVLPEKPPGSRISHQQREEWIFVVLAVVHYLTAARYLNLTGDHERLIHFPAYSIARLTVNRQNGW